MSGELEIRIDGEQLARLQAAWARAPELAQQVLGAAMDEAVLLLQREVADRTPTGVTGNLKDSIFSDVEISGDVLTGVVATTALHGEPVEFGTVAHIPPFAPILDWVVAKLGLTDSDGDPAATRAARAIQFAIGRRGTKAQRMFGNAFDATEPQVRGIFGQGVADLTAQLGAA